MSDTTRLYKIEPGATYALTFHGHLTREMRQQIKDEWQTGTDSRLIILTNVTVTEAPSE